MSYNKTTWNDNAPPAINADNLNNMEQGIEAAYNMGSSIAYEYDQYSSYAVGNLVFHNGNLYRCVEQISSPEAWNASHWTRVTIAGVMQNISSRGISGITQNDDYTLTFTFTDGTSWTTPEPVIGPQGPSGTAENLGMYRDEEGYLCYE